MREQLEQYVNLLFAGARNCEDIRQEILQNTLDRYDDLIREGKVPEAAYRLAISGIGDVNEILGVKLQETPASHVPASQRAPASTDTPAKKLLRAIAVGLYILSFIPLFILTELGMSTIGLCCTITIVAVATVLIMLGANKETPSEEEKDIPPESINPRQKLMRSISKLISTIALVGFFVISFLTGAWYITWLIFPIAAAAKQLVSAILDLKEAKNYEN